MAKNIALKVGDGGAIRKEGIASEEILPGHRVVWGGANELVKAGAGVGRAAYAVENDLIGGSISDAYSEGDTVQYMVFQRGEELQALLADGENVSVGDPLEEAADGTLVAQDTGDVVAWALEDFNNTTGAPALVEVEVA